MKMKKEKWKLYLSNKKVIKHEQYKQQRRIAKEMIKQKVYVPYMEMGKAFDRVKKLEM